MKAIIDGKRYNTETATEIASNSSDVGRSDFRFFDEELYRTSKGAWFLAGEGGAMSRYSQPVGNNGSCGGSKIIVLDDDEAREWLERAGELDAIETYFPIEDA